MKSIKELLQPVLQDLQSGRKEIEVAELWGGARSLFLLELFEESGKHLLVITATEDEAEALTEDINFFTERLKPPDEARSTVQVFPSWTVLPFEADSPDSGTVGVRMRCLYRLITGGPTITVVSAPALMQKLPPWQLLADTVVTITKGRSLPLDDLAGALASIGYEHASAVTRVGEFSRRGGIIDFFSPAQQHPVRLEFFGDTVESIRVFDPESQHSTGEIPEVVALPVRELIVTEESRARVAARTADPVLLEQVRKGQLPAGIEFFAPFFYESQELFSYLPAGTIPVVIEPDDVAKAAVEWQEKVLQGRREELGEGRTLPEAEELYISADALVGWLADRVSISMRLLGSSSDRFGMDTKSAAWLGVRLTRTQAAASVGARQVTAEGSAVALAEKLKRLRERNRVYLICGTDDAARRIRRLFSEYGVPLKDASRLVLDEEGPWPVRVMTGRLSDGFAWPELGLVLVNDEEIFGSKVHRPRQAKARAATFLTSFKELKPGDFVVHTDYGVGEYQGLTHLDVDGFETDFLTLRYEPDARLYVPLYSLDKVQKYTGTEGTPPKVDKLGAPTWAKTKERVKKDILAMAQELVAIYAAREAMRRTPLAPPDNLYREFEAAFPFEETPDQEKAIEDVLEDMQKERPMDRLVCGDVGFGKTEVALRAAFKAVEDGYQAAVIVPTTLLADQHYRTFQERLAPFSVAVELMSRFRTRVQQKETLTGLKRGAVDIVIGTHRLLQKDVVFRNLGLLVIDEEHRFGVRHKERIKEMRKMVDVLTLTATPIPRTLHMSLAGIRDLSIIQTPPLDRQAIQVVLARFGKRVVREAIAQELARGGQVFFVQNRVAGIERMAAFIQNLVPEAKIGVAHGQMKEDEIEPVMAKFIAGELSVLVTTTIIESGIDIPNANTIIINRADRFGLAELYQIKGRVGRSPQKAYAYLLTPAEEALTDVARTRLRAIQELSELGAGFRIAAQDLETRGAGNLLGKQQSGHIAAVGIDLYTQMMEEAMAELRGEDLIQEPDTQINLRVSSFIPESYINDMHLRLAAYKEIASADTDDDVDRIAADLRDRYGEIPEPARNLLEIIKLKVRAAASQVSRIDATQDSVNISFSDHARIEPDKVLKLIRRSRGTIRMAQERTLRITLQDVSLHVLSDAVKKCLQALA
jgi:transcription-repair coupling factor (superfamily II helicase)